MRRLSPALFYHLDEGDSSQVRWLSPTKTERRFLWFPERLW